MMPKMLMFSLYISCLSTSNLPWFMDLTFHVPIHHCSLQHQTLLSPSDTSTAAHLSGFGLGASFLPELLGIVLHSSPVAYWTPSDLGSSSASILSFSFFIGFSRQEYWSGLLFPSPVDHNLSELSTMTHLSLVALHGMSHSFIELDKANPILVIRLVSFLWLWFSFCLPYDKRLVEASWWERLTGGNWILFWWAGPCSVNL